MVAGYVLLITVRGSVCVVSCVLFVVYRCVLYVVRRLVLLFAMCCAVFVVGCWLMRLLLRGVCCLLMRDGG